MRRTRAAALLASLLLHACVLLLLVRARVEEPSRHVGQQIEISVNYVSKPEPQQPVEPVPVPAVAQPSKVQKVPKVAPAVPLRHTNSEPQVASAGGGQENGGGGSSDGAGAGSGAGGPAKGSPAADTPGQLTLSLSSKAGDWAVQQGSARNHDQTWRNEPGGFPDPALEKAANEARGKRNVEGWLNDAAAEARMNSGAVDAYFFTVRDALQEKAQKDADRFLSGDPKKDFVNAWQDGAKTYAKTGNPYVAGASPEYVPALDEDTPMTRFAQRFPSASLGDRVTGLKERMEMGRSLRDFAEGKFSTGLLALVEVRQGNDGRLLNLTLRQPSGNVAFDAHVMRSAPEAIAPLAPPPATGGGIHPGGLRSLWSFEGKIVYTRKLSDVSLLKDGWYLALMSAAGLGTGTFDEVNGGGAYPDFRYPHFQLKVKLLKVY